MLSNISSLAPSSSNNILDLSTKSYQFGEVSPENPLHNMIILSLLVFSICVLTIIGCVVFWRCPLNQDNHQEDSGGIELEVANFPHNGHPNPIGGCEVLPVGEVPL
ncbi:hypothetical protein [Candidatus Tisiphia endosymbiont of Beris chalybata]|uniref:hypothetical protein n=1 Tax=Candidatus Tisiphia endosymbiont of Beris chalybata TaxID=3066262 RepID=UPI00312CA9C3